MRQLGPIDVIIYEIGMLRYAHEVRPQMPPTNQSEVFAGNAALEVYLLHYRALLEFYSKPGSSYATDMLLKLPTTWAKTPAGSFNVASEDIAPIADAADKLSKLYKKRLDKQLAHCTEWRCEHGQPKQWDLSAMHTGIENVNRMFEALILRHGDLVPIGS